MGHEGDRRQSSSHKNFSLEGERRMEKKYIFKQEEYIFMNHFRDLKAFLHMLSHENIKNTRHHPIKN